MTVPRPAPAPAAARKRRGYLPRLIPVIVIVLVIVGGILVLHRKSVAAAMPGDCIAVDESGGPYGHYRIDDCADSGATLRVLAVVDGVTQQCKNVAGATNAWIQETNQVCMGDKDADPGRAINGAVVGDCAAQVGQELQKTSCDAADVTFRVLGRFTEVANDSVDTVCDTVDGATTQTSWTWQDIEDGTGYNPVGTTTDVVLCLGPVA